MKKYNFLGIESSCDDTSICIYNRKSGTVHQSTYTQKIHNKYGGTVPTISSIFHLKKMYKLVNLTIKKSKIRLNDLCTIAYSKEPGLINSLLIGSSFCKTLSKVLKIPSIGVNHLEAHIIVNLLFYNIKQYPLLALLISGGHTLIFIFYKHNEYSIIGKTFDNSIGETFDKVCRSLNLKPISGEKIYNLSKRKFKFRNINLPKPMLTSKCNNFSFSGLKTQTMFEIKKCRKMNKDFKSNIAYNFQNTLIIIIAEKVKKIMIEKKILSLLLSGGVASNNEIRMRFSNIAESFNINLYYPPKKYCTDNGLMIAFLSFIKSMENKLDKNLNIECKPKTTIKRTV